MLLLHPLFARIFDRSATPFAKFAACGLIGAILLAIPALTGELPLDFWSAAVSGAGLGYAGALIGWFYDKSRDPGVSRRTRIYARGLMIAAGLTISIAAVILIDVILKK